MAAGSILIDLLMRTGSFETDTKRAEKRLAELKKEAKAMGVAVGAALAAVGTAAAYMVKSAIDSADAASKAAQAAGVATEAYTAQAYAARQNGVEQENLSKAYTKINGLIADNGDELKALGISTTDAMGRLKTADAVFLEIADRFSSMEEGAQKSALAVDLFGERIGPQLLPLLNQGSAGIAALTDEARVLGQVLDSETAAAAEEFNDNLDRMGAAVTGVANRAAGELLPALNEVSNMLVTVAKDEDHAATASGILQTSVGGLITVFQTVAVVGSDVGFVFKSIGREIAALAAQASALGVGFKDMLGGPGTIASAMAKSALRGEFSTDQFTAISDAVKADGERARAELDKFQARIMSIGQASPVAPMSADAFRRAEIASGGGSRFQPRPIRSTGGGGGGGRTTRAPTPARAPKEFETSDRWDEASAAAAEAQIMNEAQEAWRKYVEQVAEAEKPLQAVYTQMTETQSVTERLGLTLSSAFEDAILGGGKLSDVFKGLLQDIGRVILRMHVIEPLMKSIMGGGGGPPANPFVGGGGDFLSTIVGGISSIFGGFRANGGPVAGGQAYIVGERGPEMFVPRTAGAIVPNHAMGGGGKTVKFVNYNTYGDVATMHKVRAEQRASERRMVAAVHRSETYGAD